MVDWIHDFGAGSELIMGLKLDGNIMYLGGQCLASPYRPSLWVIPDLTAWPLSPVQYKYFTSDTLLSSGCYAIGVTCDADYIYLCGGIYKSGSYQHAFVIKVAKSDPSTPIWTREIESGAGTYNYFYSIDQSTNYLWVTGNLSNGGSNTRGCQYKLNKSDGSTDQSSTGIYSVLHSGFYDSTNDCMWSAGSYGGYKMISKFTAAGARTDYYDNISVGGYIYNGICEYSTDKLITCGCHPYPVGYDACISRCTKAAPNSKTWHTSHSSMVSTSVWEYGLYCKLMLDANNVYWASTYLRDGTNYKTCFHAHALSNGALVWNREHENDRQDWYGIELNGTDLYVSTYEDATHSPRHSYLEKRSTADGTIKTVESGHPAMKRWGGVRGMAVGSGKGWRMKNGIHTPEEGLWLPGRDGKWQKQRV